MTKLLIMILGVTFSVLFLSCTSNPVVQPSVSSASMIPTIQSTSTTPSLTVPTTNIKTGATPPSQLDLTPPSKEFLADRNYELPDIPRVTCEGLKQMMDRGDNFVLVDLRFPAIYQSKHLPGAINISYFPIPSLTQAQIDNLLLGLPKDKLIIFYCACPGDEESAATADKLMKLDSGYTANIKVLWKGFWRWMELGYPVVQ